MWEPIHHFQSLIQVPHACLHNLCRHFSKRCGDWALEVCQALVVSHINLALDMTLQIKLHRSQMRWTRWPRDVVVSRTTSSYLTVTQVLIEPVPHTLEPMRWGHIKYELESWRIRVAGESWVKLLSQQTEVVSLLTFFSMKKGSIFPGIPTVTQNHDLLWVQQFFYRPLGVCPTPMTAIVSVNP